MSLENDDGNLGAADKGSEGFHESQRRSKVSYSREFLLSLSELDFCKNLPNGFDRSVLSEFEDASLGQDRPRSHGSLPLQGYQRYDYSSSSPTRGDTANFSRGVYGRWDNRSSGWNDKESNSQSDVDSESGRLNGNQSRRPWQQNSEHAGLLGSGSFPRPTGFAAGTSGLKVQANDHYQLKRTTEPYHPPRPYKAVPHARNNVTDSLNDETFGSNEVTNQDRAEEERQRRASFELIRKEQQKVLQEKQKVNTNKSKSDGLSDIAVLEEPKADKGHLEAKLDSGIAAVSDNCSGKSQGPMSRPLVPPGFRSSIVDKSSGPKILTSGPDKEVPRPEAEEIHLQSKANTTVQNGTLDNQGHKQMTTELDFSEKHSEDKNINGPKWGGDTTNTSPKLVVPTEKLSLDNHLYTISALSEVNETVYDSKVIGLMTNKLAGDKNVSSTEESSTSILEKLLGGASSVTNGSSGFIEHHDSKRDEIWSPTNSRSSKFAQWFNEDDKTLKDDFSSSRPKDLFSLIVGAEKVGSKVSTPKATELTSPEVSFESSEITNMITASIPSTATETYEQLYKNTNDLFPSNTYTAPVVLTCEDLEQTILSEYSEKTSVLEPVVQDWPISAPDPSHKKEVENNASHHLLTLLQKGTSFEAMTPFTNLETGSLKKTLVSDGGVLDKPEQSNAQNIQNSGQSLTLETLFGTAFMKELQSVDAPVSVQRGSSLSTRTDVIEPHGFTNVGHSPSTVSSILASNQKQPTKSDKIKNCWLQLDDPRIEADSLKLQTEVVPRHTGLDRAVEIQLPEEESLISLGDPMNPQKSMYGNSSTGEFLSSNGSMDILEKLAALKSGSRGDRSIAAQEGHPFARGPFNLLEPERQYQNLHAQPTHPHIHVPQMSHHQRALFHHEPYLDHINSQIRFPEHISQHDTPPSHQFPTNMLHPPFYNPDIRVTGFDIPAQQQILQQRQMPGNFPPSHLSRDFPRGSRLPSHLSHQTTNFMQEPGNLQGFPFGHRQPNTAHTGMPLPAPDAGAGSNHPEAFQRLMENELRVKSKQLHPFGIGHSQGLHVHELDMGFGYR